MLDIRVMDSRDTKAAALTSKVVRGRRLLLAVDTRYLLARGARQDDGSAPAPGTNIFPLPFLFPFCHHVSTI